MANSKPSRAPKPSSTLTPQRFHDFYRRHFLAEHQHPVNRSLHMVGTLAGLVWIPLTLWGPLPWLVLLFPVVHALPGLVGHRLFERNALVGDVRVLRKDFSPLWFIAANHRLTFELLWRGVCRVFRP